MTIVLADTAQVAPGVIRDFDADGQVITVEILDAGKHGRNPLDITYGMLRG